MQLQLKKASQEDLCEKLNPLENFELGSPTDESLTKNIELCLAKRTVKSRVQLQPPGITYQQLENVIFKYYLAVLGRKRGKNDKVKPTGPKMSRHKAAPK